LSTIKTTTTTRNTRKYTGCFKTIGYLNEDDLKEINKYFNLIQDETLKQEFLVFWNQFFKEEGVTEK
jgi:hypothetical protein